MDKKYRYMIQIAFVLVASIATHIVVDEIGLDWNIVILVLVFTNRFDIWLLGE